MLRLGFAQIDITPQGTVPKIGTRNFDGVHDPLYASAWLFGDEKEQPYIWIVLDVCIVGTRTRNTLAEEISKKTSLTGTDRLFISSTHTHSAPETRYLVDRAEPWADRYLDLLISRLSQLIREVQASSFLGRIELREGTSHMGGNRRNTELPIDPRLILFSLIDDSGRLRALLFHYPCHLTVLGQDNYLISADWLGPVRETFRAKLGVPIGFLQGAAGNIDPVCRGVLDMGDPDQFISYGYDSLNKMSCLVIDSIGEALATPPTATLDSLQCRSLDLSLPLRHGPLNKQQVEEKVKQWKSNFSQGLAIPLEQVPEDQTINPVVKKQCVAKALPSEQILHWVAEMFAYRCFLGVYRGADEAIDGQKGEVNVKIHLMDFGPLLILGVPMEVTVEVAFEWQKLVSDKIALIAGLFNGWYGYFTHNNNFKEHNASTRYETVSTLFAQEAADKLLNEATTIA